MEQIGYKVVFPEKDGSFSSITGKHALSQTYHIGEKTIGHHLFLFENRDRALYFNSAQTLLHGTVVLMVRCDVLIPSYRVTRVIPRADCTHTFKKFWEECHIHPDLTQDYILNRVADCTYFCNEVLPVRVIS